MKRFILLALAGALALALGACDSPRAEAGQQGGLAAASTSDAGTGDAQEEAEAPGEATPEAAESPAEAPEGDAGENAVPGVTTDADGRVQLTLSADTLSAMGVDAQTFAANSAGFESVQINPDGGVTVGMTGAQHEELLAELRQAIDLAMRMLVEDEEGYPSILEVSADADMTRFTLTVDREAYEAGEESLAEVLLSMYGVMYQVYSGNEPVSPTFALVDAATGEVYQNG